MDSKEKSRKNKRKEARLEKRKRQFSSWIQHQKQKSKLEKKHLSKPKPLEKEKSNIASMDLEKEKIPFFHLKEDLKDTLSMREQGIEPYNPSRGRGKKNVKKKSKTKFEEYLDMELRKGVVSIDEDLELERKLAKKLKVKNGRLGGLDDGINMLFDGIGSMSEIHDEILGREDFYKNEYENVSKRKNLKKKKVTNVSQDTENDTILDESESKPVETLDNEPSIEAQSGKASTTSYTLKYVAPHFRSQTRNESEELNLSRRRVRGLLNKLSESNVESITEEMATIFQTLGRSVGCQMIGDEVVASCSSGPRGNEQYAAVFAAFVAGMACLVGIDFGAKLLASVAQSFEDEYLKEDGLSVRNLTLFLCYMCIFGVCSSDLIYDLLHSLGSRLLELDVSTILAILQCCGMKLRGDDPSAMKDFILNVQIRVNGLKSDLEGNTSDMPQLNNKRMEFMLETICDIKNNKKRVREDPIHHSRLKKWLQKLRVEDILLRGLKWGKLLDPDKKGQWWLSSDITTPVAHNVEEVAKSMDKEIHEAQHLLQLAVGQRMNTDARRAIFCVIMSGEDYLDAFEKILRLDLPGKQDREIMRVLLECCLQEKVFNKYYTALASKLCSHDKNHKFTLQYCLWDRFKEIESMDLIRSMNLARFVSMMLCSFTLSLSLLKSVDLSDPIQLTPKRIMCFRMLFESLFEHPDSLIWNVFTRVAVTPELESLRSSIHFFITRYVEASPEKLKFVKKALENAAGVLMG